MQTLLKRNLKFIIGHSAAVRHKASHRQAVNTESHSHGHASVATCIDGSNEDQFRDIICKLQKSLLQLYDQQQCDVASADAVSAAVAATLQPTLPIYQALEDGDPHKPRFVNPLLVDRSFVDRDTEAFVSSVSLRPLLGGNSNTMFVVNVIDSRHPSKQNDNAVDAAKEEGGVSPRPSAIPPLLLRVYGSSMSHIIDREQDLHAMAFASKHGIGPRLWCNFDWGRLEEFLESCTTLSTSHLVAVDEPEYLRSVAESLRHLHSIGSPNDTPSRRARGIDADDDGISSTTTLETGTLTPDTTPASPQDPNPIPVFRRTVDRLICRLKDQSAISTAPGDSDSVEHAMALLVQDLEVESHWLEAKLQEFPTTMCHNDLNPGNILWLEEDDALALNRRRIQLIDFEYSGWNYRSFDLGNTVCEMDYDYATLDVVEPALVDLASPAAMAPTQALDWTFAGFKKPLANSVDASTGNLSPFAPHLPIRIMQYVSSHSTSASIEADPLAKHIVDHYVAKYHRDDHDTSSSHTATAVNAVKVHEKHLQELFIGMMASHLLWCLWGIVIAVDGVSPVARSSGHVVIFPRGSSGLDYAAYAECRLLEYMHLKEWLFKERLLA